MILYHGTNIDFQQIDLAKCRPHKDFGQGFYLTDIESQAQNMAIRRCEFSEEGFPVVQRYEFAQEVLLSPDIAVLSFESPSVEWARFVVQNRNRQPLMPHNYDIVIGPIADDGVVFQINRYLEGFITIETLVSELRFKHLNNQYCFCTPLAISHLHKL